MASTSREDDTSPATSGSPSQSQSQSQSQINKDDENSKKSSSTDTDTTVHKSNAAPKHPKKHNYKYFGNIPDINWRAIPMEHLRSHPLYIPLPHPDTIFHLRSLEEVRTFRQDSWQWDALHSGRCTTSQAAPALGLLEPNASKELGIPRSLQKGCMGAFFRLGKPALRTLDDMNRILCTGGNGGDKKVHRVWKSMNSDAKKYPFAAKYTPLFTEEDIDERKEAAKKYMKTLKSPMGVRMGWGNTQEATAILTALNYFSKQDPELKIREVGMCGAGLDLNVTATTAELIVGASPDSVIEYSNGTLEILEVKNHCPFVPTEWTSGSKAQKNKKMKMGDYRIREFPMEASVPPMYIPQLMMEMLCCGKNCRSAIMVRQTATSGAVILRLHRDDAWIEEMIHWLQRFMTEYVDVQEPPPPNFFWDCEEESERYRKFVERTKELSESVDLVEHVDHNSIQRVLGDQGMQLPLFLD